VAGLFRSISVKIFGVSLGLLIIMVGAAFWSASLTGQVSQQLRTLNQSLFPLAMTLGDLHSVAQAQDAHARKWLDTPDQAAVQACLAGARSLGQAAGTLVGHAERQRAEGARVAAMDRDRLRLARLEPMIAELKYQERRLGELTVAACDLHATDAQMDATRAQAHEVERRAESISREIKLFVQEGALLVGDNQTKAMEANLAMIGIAAVVGLMLAWLVGRGLTRPIVRLQAGAQAVSAGSLDAEVPVTSRDEIGDVTRAFNAMVIGLREKERIKETFGQYVDPRVVEGLIGGGRQSIAGEKQVATVFFSDIAGFSTISERLAPSNVVDLINAYFSEMSAPIRDSAGIIDKYIGDAIMAFWVPPFVEAARQAGLACRAALAQFARLPDFQKRLPDVIGLRRDVPAIDFRVGIASGEVVVGSIGSTAARSFTAMGDTVNLAARLETANKAYGTRLLIDGATFDMAADSIAAREVDTIAVMGRVEPLSIYELAALAGDLSPERRTLFDVYAQGLAHYRAGDWPKAEKALRAALAQAPGDGPSRILLDRVTGFQAAPPARWDGVWQMTSK
jgi:adenylate cyclase